VAEDGSLSIKKYWAIQTNGTNMSAILENPYLNIYECYSTSVQEIEQHYGIHAARNKIIHELKNIIKGNVIHGWISMYADEMAYIHNVTNIQRSGLGKREQNQVLQRVSFGGSIQVLQSAAINGLKDNLTGISSKLVMGTCPRFGTIYNDIGIDYQKIADTSKSPDEILDAL